MSETVAAPEDRMSGAEFAVTRQLLGITIEELAGLLRVNPRTVRSWESERDPISGRVPLELAVLAAEQTDLAHKMVASDEATVIPRTRADAAGLDRPRGWYLAAAARAVILDPSMLFDWSGGESDPS